MPLFSSASSFDTDVGMIGAIAFIRVVGVIGRGLSSFIYLMNVG